MAALVMNGRSMAGTPTFSPAPNAAIQRDGDGKTAPLKPDNYDEAAKKIADALQETAIGKQLKAKAEELGKEFLASVEGKVVAGTALGGALAVIVATRPMPSRTTSCDSRPTPGCPCRFRKFRSTSSNRA